MQVNLNGNKIIGKGISIIEIIVVTFVISVALAALLGSIAFYLKTSIFIEEATKANFLAQEAMEALRNFRDAIAWTNDDPANQYDGFGVVAVDTAYYLSKSNDVPPKWMLLRGSETIGIFTREIYFENVQRDTNKDIVASGGTNDPNTKKVTVRVMWKNQEINLVTYFTNWR
jgi:type II secretory pathway pseudopilin PulG